MSEHGAEGDAGCGEHFAQHPTRPELVAVCTLPSGHDGDHDNLLPKAGHPAPPGSGDTDAGRAGE
jgi:hypothetical protein